jgi:hypothetical protein
MVMKRFIAAGAGVLFLCAAVAAAPTPCLAAGATPGDGADKNATAGSNQPRTIHSRRRPRTHAMPRGMSDRQIQLRKEQEKSR